MRWVLIDGRAHAAKRASGGKTLCGKTLRRASIARGPIDNRCPHCDRSWRAEGRQQKVSTRVDKKAVYTPRHTFRDWEHEDLKGPALAHSEVWHLDERDTQET